jgi:hypothetical protein
MIKRQNHGAQPCDPSPHLLDVGFLFHAEFDVEQSAVQNLQRKTTSLNTLIA